METNNKKVNAAAMILESQEALQTSVSSELEEMLKCKAENGDAKASKMIKTIRNANASDSPVGSSSYQGKITSYWSAGTDNVEIYFNGEWKDLKYSNSDQYNAMCMLALHAYLENRTVLAYHENDVVYDLYVY